MSRSKKSAPMTPLTPKEKRVLEFIENYMSQFGSSPTYQEIKDYFGFASFNSVQRYLKQLQRKDYIDIPGGNQKRAIRILHSAFETQAYVNELVSPKMDQQNPKPNPLEKEAPHTLLNAESLSLPLLGRVAAGLPIEALESNESVEVPISLVRNPSRSFALLVEGQSMIDDGILDGDVILVQKQDNANNGEIVVASVDNEATVKRFYLHKEKQDEFDDLGPQVELRPSNSALNSYWYSPDLVKIEGIVVGLVRKYL
ncbi:MAG: repressor LexA [Bdellovibrionaceae bacterium]|nr:repressor LexA [Pseudobdellovibrionaceae bacterium]